MRRGFKAAVYLFLFGVLALFFVLFRQTPQRQFSPSEILGASSRLSLFVEPDDGRTPLLALLGTAQQEVLVEVYLLSDPEVISALVSANQRTETKVILEEYPFGGGNLNKISYRQLTGSGVNTLWSSPSFVFTHVKMIIIDGRLVCILNMNLTRSAFTKNREYNICSEDQPEVTAARQIFLADWEKKSYQLSPSNLVIGPDNARGKLTAFIDSAQKSLDIEMEVLNDAKIITLLKQKGQNIPVRIIIPDPKKIPLDDKLRDLSFALRTLSSPYPHAKLIIVDGERAYVGSVNLTAQSLDKNREVGILISQPDVISRLNSYFEKDWEKATAP